LTNLIGILTGTGALIVSGRYLEVSKAQADSTARLHEDDEVSEDRFCNSDWSGTFHRWSWRYSKSPSFIEKLGRRRLPTSARNPCITYAQNHQA